MATQEQPPVSPQERQPQPVERTPVSAQVVQKTLQERITEIIAKNGALEDLKEAHARNAQEGPRLQEKRKELAKDVRIILAELQGRSSASERVLPPAAVKIIKSLDVGKIGRDSAPVVYEFLRYVAANDPSHNLETADGTMGALRAVLDVSEFDAKAAKTLLSQLVEYAEGRSFSGEELLEAKNYLKPQFATKEELNRRRKERNSHYDDIFGPIKTITLTERARENIRAQLKTAAAGATDGNGMSDSLLEKRVDEIVKMETERIQDELIGHFNVVVSSSNSPKDHALAVQKYNAAVTEFRSRGLISTEDFEMLKSLPDNPAIMEYFEDEGRRMEGNDIISEASRVFVPTGEQVRLLRAISSAESLKDFFYSEIDRRTGSLRYLKDDKVQWKVFYDDMKGIFEELLSIADRNPNQFFEQAFNPMYEGHLYQLLLKRLTHLGSQISVSEDEWFKDQKIEIKQPIEDPSPSRGQAPYKSVLQTKTQVVSLDVAVGNYFANNMTDLLHVREHLHNVSAICNQGLGWEQLSQYSERMSLAKFDWIVRQESELSLAYNLYMTSLQQELAANRGIVSAQFGRADEVWQLNSAELKAFLQLKAHLRVTHPELAANESVLNQKAIQKVRMASAIASGITGEFWNTLMTARMPITTERGKDGEGREVDKSGNTYVGTHHRGYEKMIGQLDFDMVLERFGLPKFYNAIRYVPRQRNMSHPPGAYSKEGYFDHSIVYRLKYLIEDANQNGRTDELADLDSTWVTFNDYMRTKCVGLFSRGGWRFAQWEAFKAFEDEGLKKVDYKKTLHNVRQVGSYIVKQFIDSIDDKSVGSLSESDVEALSGIRGKTGAQLSDGERKNFKIIMYEHVLFGQIGRVNPTKFLQLEKRRWTPKGEKLLRESLTEYLQGQLGSTYREGIVGTHLYTMYVSALTLVEKSTWAKNKENGVVDYTLSESDIDAHRQELLDFYEQYKANIGEYESFGAKISIGETPEEFLRILKGCQKTLSGAIAAPRFTREDRREGETLQKRFAKFLNVKDGSSMGDIESLIAGDDLDLSQFYFGGTGGFSTTRMMGETFGITSKMNPAIGKLLNEALPKFVRGQYKDIHELEKAINEIFVPIFKDIQVVIANMDKNQADEFMVSLALFLSNMVGKDRILRIKGIGGAIDWWRRQRYETTQSSVMQDFYRNDLKNPSTSLDSDEIYALGHIILNAVNVPPHKEIPHHYETVLSIGGRPIITRRVNEGEEYITGKLFGFIPYKKKTMKEGVGQKYTLHDFEHCAGIEGKTKWLETYLPVAGATLVLLLIAMAYLANQKNKKK